MPNKMYSSAILSSQNHLFFSLSATFLPPPMRKYAPSEFLLGSLAAQNHLEVLPTSENREAIMLEKYTRNLLLLNQNFKFQALPLASTPSNA